MTLDAKRKGFTLIEMLVVLLIIAVMSVIVLPRIMNSRKRAKDAATRQTLAQLNTAVEEFEADLNCYPTSLDDLFTRVAAGYAGVGIAGTATTVVSVSDADTLWRGPYFMKATALPPVPLNQGSWSLITTFTNLGKVSITGVTIKASDGTYYTDW